MAMLYLRNKPIGAISSGGGGSYTEGDGINISAQNAISVDTAFTEASTRANIASGDTLATIWGKIKKFFSDLKTVAFTGSYTDLSNQPTIPTNTNQLTNGAGFITSSGSCAYATSAGSATDSTKLPLTGGTLQSSSDTPLTLKSNNNTSVFIRYRGADNTTYGYIGAKSDKKPYFYDTGYHRIALWDELLLQYATPFYMPTAQGTRIRFTFTGLSNYESIHLLIFGRYSSADLMPICSSTGFSDVKWSPIVDDTTYRMGVSYSQNNGYTLAVQVGAWSAAWGIFIHPAFPNATMTMTRES